MTIRRAGRLVVAAWLLAWGTALCGAQSLSAPARGAPASLPAAVLGASESPQFDSSVLGLAPLVGFEPELSSPGQGLPAREAVSPIALVDIAAPLPEAPRAASPAPAREAVALADGRNAAAGTEALAESFGKEVAPALAEGLASEASMDDAYSAGLALDRFLVGGAAARKDGGEVLVPEISQSVAPQEPTWASPAKRRELALPLRLDPFLDPVLRGDLANLQRVVNAVDLRRSSFYLGLPPGLRVAQRGYFQWLRAQLNREGGLPPLESSSHILNYGDYWPLGGLALINPAKSRTRWERMITVMHEVYHHYARLSGIPVLSEGRQLQERDAMIAELLIWAALPGLVYDGAAWPDLRVSNFIRILKEGKLGQFQDYVDRIYSLPPDEEGGDRESWRRVRSLKWQLTGRMRVIEREAARLAGRPEPGVAMIRELLRRRWLAIEQVLRAPYALFRRRPR